MTTPIRALDPTFHKQTRNFLIDKSKTVVFNLKSRFPPHVQLTESKPTMKRSGPLSALAFILGSVLSAPSTATDAASDVEARIQRIENGLLPRSTIKGRPLATMNLADRMRFLKVPGLSVAVINNGAIEWARGYGLADSGNGEKVTTATLFQAASISKPVAAMSALSLVEKGKLALDEDVNTRLVSWKLPQSEFTKDKHVTLRALLSHTAGTTVSGFPGYAAGQPVPTAVQLLDGAKPANSGAVRVDTVPGAKTRYSGGGFTVAQLMMTDVTGQPFHRLMQRSVLDPLGMKHSTFAQPLPVQFQRLAASGHDRSGVAIKGKWHTYPEQAAAGLWTTPSDLARFAMEIQKSNAGASNKVLSKAMTAQMLTRISGPFGLGIGVGEPGREATFSHGGANEGFRSLLFAYTGTGQGAVLMTNGDNGGHLINEVMRSISREYGWPDYRSVEKAVVQVDARIYNDYVGEYEVAGTKFVITAEPGRLFIQSPPLGPGAHALYPEKETSFFMTAFDTTIDFEKDGAGVTSALVQHEGMNFKAKKVK